MGPRLGCPRAGGSSPTPRASVAWQDFAAPVPDCPSGDCEGLAVALQAWAKAEAAAVEAAAPAASAAAAELYAAKLIAWGEKARPSAKQPHGKVPNVLAADRLAARAVAPRDAERLEKAAACYRAEWCAAAARPSRAQPIAIRQPVSKSCTLSSRVRAPAASSSVGRPAAVPPCRGAAGPTPRVRPQSGSPILPVCPSLGRILRRPYPTARVGTARASLWRCTRGRRRRRRRWRRRPRLRRWPPRSSTARC